MDIKFITIIVVSITFEAVLSETWYVHNQHGYFFGSERLHQSPAQSRCQGKHSNLTSVHSAEENYFLKNISQAQGSDNTWIGLIPGPTGPCNCGTPGTSQCTTCRKSWEWNDGTTINYDEFHDWAGVEPQNTERCARLTPKGWAGRGCRFNYNYICKVDINEFCPEVENCQCDPSTPACELDKCCCFSPCENGATCDGDIDSYICHCVLGYTGYNCESNIDDCQYNPCFNEASCLDGVNEYTCVCQPGYTGEHCESEIDECASNPCMHGVCMDEFNHYICNCSSGFGGINCEIAPKSSESKLSGLDKLDSTDLEITLAVFAVLACVLGIIAIVMAIVVYKHKLPFVSKDVHDNPRIRKENDYIEPNVI